MVERGAFFEGGREPFPGGKKVPFPPQSPPSFQKPLICCFAPQGNPCSGTYSARKKSGKNAAGNDYFVSKAPARQVSVRRGGREGRYLLPPKKESVFYRQDSRPAYDVRPGVLNDQHFPFAGGYGPVSSYLMSATIKKRLPLRTASDERVLEKEGAWGRESLFAASSDRRRPQGRARCDEGSYGHRQQSKGLPPPASIFPRYRRFPARGCCRLRSWPSVPACA